MFDQTSSNDPHSTQQPDADRHLASSPPPAQPPSLEVRATRLVIRAIIGALIGLAVARLTYAWLW